MKSFISLLVVLLCGLAGLTPLCAQSTAFTYQGRLMENGSPFSGATEMRFSLFDVPTGGVAIATSAPAPATISVSNGLFTATLDFGAAAFSGADRWLEIQMRTGLGAFTTLSPRQPITPTPYAMTALNVLGVDGHALHSANGSVTNAVFVDDAGNVGIGTTNPISKLHVVSTFANDFPPRLVSPNSAGFNAGWDFYHGEAGRGYIGVPDFFAPIAPNELIVFGAPGVEVSLWGGAVRALTADTFGNVGIGTATPQTRLDVRGDVQVSGGEVRLGPLGKFRAASGEETLRIVRGAFFADGTIMAGSGFTVSRRQDQDFRYIIQFNTPFADAPTVTATSGLVEFPTSILITIADTTADACEISASPPRSGDHINRPVHFIAVGPR